MVKDVTTKRINPYQRLLAVAREWANAVVNRRRVRLWTYPFDKVEARVAWSLRLLAERVQAAKQLGYGVELRWDEGEGLVVEYVAETPRVPLEIRE